MDFYKEVSNWHEKEWIFNNQYESIEYPVRKRHPGGEVFW